jgi:hypothetical protein
MPYSVYHLVLRVTPNYLPRIYPEGPETKATSIFEETGFVKSNLSYIRSNAFA